LLGEACESAVSVENVGRTLTARGLLGGGGQVARGAGQAQPGEVADRRHADRGAESHRERRPGAPLGASKTVSPDSVADGAAPGPANGYSILDAADLDAAVGLVRAHPYVERGGSLQVSEAVAP
jgi:hypothetical protein